MNFFKTFFSVERKRDLSNIISNDDTFVVDVRTAAEFAKDHIEGSVNIPLEQIFYKLSQFSNRENIIVFCDSGTRSRRATSILKLYGFSNVINGGSWNRVSRWVNK